MQEIDIWRTAQILMDAHGEEAVIQAAMRADACLDQGNLEGISVWKRVMAAIQDLQKMAPSGAHH